MQILPFPDQPSQNFDITFRDTKFGGRKFTKSFRNFSLYVALILFKHRCVQEMCRQKSTFSLLNAPREHIPQCATRNPHRGEDITASDKNRVMSSITTSFKSSAICFNVGLPSVLLFQVEPKLSIIQQKGNEKVPFKHYSRNKGVSCPHSTAITTQLYIYPYIATHQISAASSSLFTLRCVGDKTFLQERQYALGSEISNTFCSSVPEEPTRFQRVYSIT